MVKMHTGDFVEKRRCGDPHSKWDWHWAPHATCTTYTSTYAIYTYGRVSFVSLIEVLQKRFLATR